MTQRQREIQNFLNSFLFQRTTVDYLNKELSKFFNKEIKVDNITAGYFNAGIQEISETDYHLQFGIDHPNDETEDEDYGIYDIMYLPMICPCELTGNNILITEIRCDFDS